MKMLAQILFFAVIGGSSLSCNHDKPISFGELPERARTFITTHFPGDSVSHATKDRDGFWDIDYTVHLRSGTEIDFDKQGNWTSVDGEGRSSIPTGFVGDGILRYIRSSYPGVSVTGISKERRGFEVELSNGLDLDFDEQGGFLRID